MLFRVVDLSKVEDSQIEVTEEALEKVFGVCYCVNDFFCFELTPFSRLKLCAMGSRIAPMRKLKLRLKARRYFL